MPRSPSENERIRQMAKEKILETAMDLFIHQGYHATSISDVAKKAGTSKGLLYNYFSGKEGLLAAMVEERIASVAEVMENSASLQAPADQLKYILEQAIDNVYQQPEVFRFTCIFKLSPKRIKSCFPTASVLWKRLHGNLRYNAAYSKVSEYPSRASAPCTFLLPFRASC